MRTDHYGEHLLTHIREILVRDKPQRDESMAEKSVCVYLRQLRNSATVGPQMLVSFACCLGCGKWEQSIGRKGVWRAIHERWCGDCKKPHQGPGVWDTDDIHCACNRLLLPRPQHSKPNETEDFVDKHNSECTGAFERIAEWFDLSKPKPKAIPIVRKTAQKRTQKTKATKTPTETPTPPTPPTPAAIPTLAPPSSKPIPDLIARAFPTIFDSYDYETDDDSDADEDEVADAKEQRHTERTMGAEKMIATAGKYHDKILKQVRDANKIKHDAVADATRRAAKEVDEMEQKLFREQEASEEKTKRIQLLETGRDDLVAELQRLRDRLTEYGISLTDE